MISYTVKRQRNFKKTIFLVIMSIVTVHFHCLPGEVHATLACREVTQYCRGTVEEADMRGLISRTNPALRHAGLTDRPLANYGHTFLRLLLSS
jgi:hypothetical protein